MIVRRLGPVLLLLLTAAAALAQSTPAAEFGRSGGGEIALPFKQSGAFSGSLGFTLSSGGSASKGFGGTVGGSLFGDRLSFFATGQRDDVRRSVPALPQLPALRSSSLSLHTTVMPSSNSFFSVSVSQQQPAFFTHW